MQVLRAKVSLLEGRALNTLALAPAAVSGTPGPGALLGLPGTAPHASSAAAATAAALGQVEQLRARLGTTTEQLQGREATCRKYKVCVPLCGAPAGL